MKKLTILSVLALSGLIFNTADAQIRIHLGFNLTPHRVVYEPAPVYEQVPVYEDQQPVYDNSNDDYYYLPDVGAYYSVNEQCYYYNDGDSWVSAAYLPGAYRDYDWRSARRYEVRENRPFMHNDVYMSRYNGHEVREWAHNNYDNHYRGGNQEADHFDRNAYRGNGQHFDNRGQDGFAQPQQNRGDEHRFNNRGQGGFAQPQQNRGNDQHYNNRGQGYSQPSNQNNGYDRGNRGGNGHFTQNRSQGGFTNRGAMTRF